MRPPDMPENLPNVWIAVEINRDRPAPLKRLPVRQACGKICRDLATFTLRATKTSAPLPSVKRLEAMHRKARDLIQSDESLRERALAALARAAIKPRFGNTWPLFPGCSEDRKAGSLPAIVYGSIMTTESW